MDDFVVGPPKEVAKLVGPTAAKAPKAFQPSIVIFYIYTYIHIYIL